MIFETAVICYFQVAMPKNKMSSEDMPIPISWKRGFESPIQVDREHWFKMQAYESHLRLAESRFQGWNPRASHRLRTYYYCGTTLPPPENTCLIGYPDDTQ